MATGALTPEQIYQTALQAGFSKPDAVIATAIAMAESGGRPTAIGDKNLTEPGEQSTGLWQINYRPSRDYRNQLRNPTADLDPTINARAAYKISDRGKNWAPWSTYNNGAYQQFLPQAAKASNEPGIINNIGVKGTGKVGGSSLLSQIGKDVTSFNPFDPLGFFSGGGLADVKNPLDTLTLLAKPLLWIIAPNNVTRVVLFILGVIFILLGFFFLAKDMTG